MFPAALRAQVAGRVLLVGDAVAVDIESAVTAGWDSLLVLISSSASHSARLPWARFVVSDFCGRRATTAAGTRGRRATRCRGKEWAG